MPFFYLQNLLYAFSSLQDLILFLRFVKVVVRADHFHLSAVMIKFESQVGWLLVSWMMAEHLRRLFYLNWAILKLAIPCLQGLERWRFVQVSLIYYHLQSSYCSNDHLAHLLFLHLLALRRMCLKAQSLALYSLY